MANRDVTYRVIRDTREKKDKGWMFEQQGECLGTIIGKLDTADYSIEGFTDTFCIERKANTAELGMNIFEKRFEAELKRLELFTYPYMIFEFEYQDVFLYPINSGLPKNIWHKVGMTSEFMSKTISRYMVQYKTQIIFAGSRGKDVAQSLFHSIAKYGKPNLNDTNISPLNNL